MNVLRKPLHRAGDCILCLVRGTFPSVYVDFCLQQGSQWPFGKAAQAVDLFPLSSLLPFLTLSPLSKPLFSLPLPLFLPSRLL